MKSLMHSEVQAFSNWVGRVGTILPNAGYHDVLRVEVNGQLVVYKKRKGSSLETCQRGSRLVNEWRSCEQQIAA